MNPTEQVEYDVSLLNTLFDARNNIKQSIKSQAEIVKDIKEKLNIEINLINSFYDNLKDIDKELIEIMNRRNMKTTHNHTIIPKTLYTYDESQIIDKHPELTKTNIIVDKVKAKEKITELIEQGLVKADNDYYLRVSTIEGTKINR